MVGNIPTRSQCYGQLDKELLLCKTGSFATFPTLKFRLFTLCHLLLQISNQVVNFLLTLDYIVTRTNVH